MRLFPLLVVLALVVSGCGEPDDDFDRVPAGGSGGAGGTAGSGGSGGSGGTGGDGGSGGSGGVGGIGGVGGEGGTGGAWVDVPWEPCPRGGGECTAFDVPLDWDDPTNGTIPFVVRKIASDVQPAEGQVWLLQGGPGSSGWPLTVMAPYIEYLVPNHDVLIPDYRGNGYSAWLGCEGETDGSMSAACVGELNARWGDDIAHFSTTATARDIHQAVERLRRPGQRVLLYGTSYGTFVGNRLLTLFPEVADAALLDSVCPASGCDIRQVRNANLVAENIFGLCGDDAFCAGKLGADPFGRLLALLDQIDAGHCADLAGSSTRMLIEQMVLLLSSDRELAPLALAVAYRAERCSVDDMWALYSLYEFLSAPQGFDPMPAAERSSYLYYQIMLSEFWPEGLDADSAAAEEALLPMQGGGSLAELADFRDQWPWPLPATPAAEKRWASTETPLLLLNGDLDAQTHVDGLHDVEASFRNESQQLVIFPLVGHGVVGSSAPAPGEGGLPCGMVLMRDFFADPATPVDTSCVAASPSLDFVGTPLLANSAFGTTDIWENEAARNLALPAPLTPAQDRAFEAVRRRIPGLPSW